MEKLNQKQPAFAIDNHTGETAWILGAGTTLNEVWDWQVLSDKVRVMTMNSSSLWCWGNWRDGQPQGVLFKGIQDIQNYRRPLDYWFCIDGKVTTPTLQPEWTYANIALRHPTAKKIMLNGLNIPPDCPNLSIVNMRDDWQRSFNLKKQSAVPLMRGPSVIIPTLFYVHKAKFKNVILSGVDFCRYVIDGKEERRFFDSIGVYKNHEKNDHKAVSQYRRRDTAGNICYQEPMMQNHMNAAMPLIRAMQNEGVNIFKTSTRGMVSVPFIDSDRTIKAIANGGRLKFETIKTGRET